MYVRASTEKVHFKRVNGYLVPIEEDDCGSGAIVWGFIIAATTVLIIAALMCMGES